MDDSTKQSGFLLIDKPEGITSFDVLRDLKKKLGRAPRSQAKWGHAGTLDPFATGLLIVLVGHATRLMQYVLMLPKTYEAELRLGATSDTDDTTGVILPSLSKEGWPSESEVGRVLSGFTGSIQQTPPAYAAIKVHGKKLYDYARAGEAVAIKPRPVMIYKVELLDYRYPKAVIRVECGSGTYIRALGRDVGRALGTGAYVEKLRRTGIGPWLATQADPHTVHPVEELVAHLPSVLLTDDVAQSVRQGNPTSLAASFAGREPNQPIALLDTNKQLIGIGLYDAATSLLKPHKIFPRIAV